VQIFNNKYIDSLQGSFKQADTSDYLFLFNDNLDLIFIFALLDLGVDYPNKSYPMAFFKIS